MNTKYLPFLVRTRDILVAVIGLLALSPFLLAIAIWIKLDSKGPIFFRGARSGKNGKIFNILKFRTMYETKESYKGPKITGEGDPRITKVGKFLRNSKINEFPQLWNVLVGEMSLVGPRPEDPGIVETWSEDVKAEILSIRPGITSPASVLFRDEESMLSNKDLMEKYFGTIQPSKIRLDQLYVRHRSFLVDLDVIMWTFLVLIPGLSKYKPPERMLYGGVANKTGLYLVNWFVIDFAIAILAISANGIFWRLVGPIHLGIIPSLDAALEFAVIFTIVGAVLGIQKINWSKASPSDIFEIAMASFVATIVLVILNESHWSIPLRLIITSSITTFFGFVIARYRARLVTGMATRFLNFRKGGNIFKERVLIVGSGDAGLFAAWLLENSREARHFRVVGFVDDDFVKQGGRIRGIPILGGRNDILQIAETEDIGIILFAIHNICSEEKNQILETCLQTSAQIVMFPDVIGTLNIISRSNGHKNSEAIKIDTESGLDEIIPKLDELKKEIQDGNLDTALNQIEIISKLIQIEKNCYEELLEE